jgi:purine-nucleoside phosphorylase
MSLFDMSAYRKNIFAAANKIKLHLRTIPQYAIILGSGLSSLSDSIQDPICLTYEEIPGFPKVTVAGHDGILIAGRLHGGDNVILLKGRFHYYEGHPMENVVFPIRVLLQLGIKNLILTNAAGGINDEFNPGDLMILKDHISLFCESPLRGENFDEWGPRFPDQSSIYKYRIAEKAARNLGINAFSGVYAYTKGPMFETPAEIQFLYRIGADAVGMSTVPEAIVASQGGMNVIGISCITNFAAGIQNKPLTHQEVLEVGEKGASNMVLLIHEIIKEGMF